MPPQTYDTRNLLLSRLFAVVTVVACAGLFAAAALVPAPPAVLPLAALVCIGCPMLVAWHMRHTRDPVGELRRSLDELPETEHPLGL
jgi:peptidoglycan/LPS O-acetylase OafA/YrhL